MKMTGKPILSKMVITLNSISKTLRMPSVLKRLKEAENQSLLISALKLME